MKYGFYRTVDLPVLLPGDRAIVWDITAGQFKYFDGSAWLPFGGAGSVTSVALTEPVEFNVVGSPITGSGTFAVTKANQTAHYAWLGPLTGSPAPPTFRAIDASDLPGGGSGTVTSVGLVVPTAEFSVSGSPVTTSGTLAIAKALQNANKVWAGPALGADAVPVFRHLVFDDLPISPVVPGSYTNTTITVNQQGSITSISNGSAGTVTNVSGTTPITVINNTTTPVVSLDNTAVTPGSYTLTNLTVDQKGRLTAASSGSAGPSGSGGRSFTVHVAADDSTANEKLLADVVCNATDAQICMDHAFTLLPSVGGDIKLAEGTYVWGTNNTNYTGFTLGRYMVLDHGGVRIMGAGPNATKFIRAFNGAPNNFGLVITGTHSGIEISNLSWNGSGLPDTTNDNGILIDANVSNVWIHDCIFDEWGSNAIRSGSNAGHVRIQNNTFLNGLGSGGAAISTSTGTADMITGNIFDNEQFGIAYAGAYSTIADNTLRQISLLSNPIQITGSYNAVSNNRMSGGNYSITVGGTGNMITGNKDGQESGPSAASLQDTGTANFYAGNYFVSTLVDSGSGTIFNGQRGNGLTIFQGDPFYYHPSAGSGKVLTSDANGTGTWQTPAAGGVTSVTGTAPVVSSGGMTPAISMAAATSSVPGYLTTADWTTFNNKGSGTVTSVVAGTGLSGGTITSTGTISMPNTGPGISSCTTCSISIDVQGRVTAASNGTPGVGGSGNVTTFGTYASRPAAGTSGNSYVASDSPILSVDNGATWNEYAYGYKLTPPGALTGQATTSGSNGGSINSSATSWVVTSSSGFPATPFVVLAGTELIKVTTVSGTTWTISRGYDGTTAATQTDGVTITEQKWWWMNQVAGTVSDTTLGGIKLDFPTNGAGAYNFRGLFRLAPSTPYTVTAAFSGWTDSPNAQYGIAWRQMGALTQPFAPGYVIMTSTAETDFSAAIWPLGMASSTSATAYATLSTDNFRSPLYFLRIADNGTNRITSISGNGYDWEQVHSIARTSSITPDEIGFFVGSSGTAISFSHIWMLSWLQQ